MSAREADARRIFLDAVENHTPDQWAGLLQAACGDDQGLRERVQALLHAHRASHPLLDAANASDTLDVPPGSTCPHPQIGRYMRSALASVPESEHAKQARIDLTRALELRRTNCSTRDDTC